MNSLQNDLILLSSTFWEKECQCAKYYAIIVDSKPDSSHDQQTTFLLRYQVRNKSQFVIVDRFLKFADCSDKTESDIAQIITEAFERYAIPFADYGAHGYDNWANISGK